MVLYFSCYLSLFVADSIFVCSFVIHRYRMCLVSLSQLCVLFDNSDSEIPQLSLLLFCVVLVSLTLNDVVFQVDWLLFRKLTGNFSLLLQFSHGAGVRWPIRDIG